ncbi:MULTISPECIES: glycerate kinase [Symbiopectobacterium]|uniref:glycerate kinase n=1 Tax=Symbiopectobacterium TaxID=801 RepID=UPI001A1D6475|nr:MULTISPECIES: glycerate kinase [Symbiopectobacterium]MBG6248833.1 glycerate kinase [Candidatus Symbiopectobacterium sp. PLON1]MBT9430382.1 glycerate kinase [Candidatus Symbiopectobacterium endolongispinus]
MKIVIAPDSYKESLSAQEVATQIEAGFRGVFPDASYVKLPVAASGLERVPSAQRNPLLTTSYGTGELIRSALDYGVKHCIIGIGGSATNDGGAGMAQALGAKLLDAQGESIGFGGGALDTLKRVDVSELDQRIKSCRFEVACDVTNPLTGKLGASAVFGPQKGATPAMIVQLDNALKQYAEVIRHSLDIDVDQVPGSGAAGGMGAALLAFCGAELRQGIEIVTEALGLDELVRDASLVITGEGRIDSQTVHGKVPIGVARVAKRYNKPVVGIAGSLTADVGVVHEHGLDAVFSVLYNICSLEEALDNAAANVRMTARNVAATIKLAQTLQ